MEDARLIIDLALALGAAAICGGIAQRLGLPVIVGYITAGLFVGPNTPGFVADRHQAELLANVGVAFLMFALGVEFSLADLLKVRRIAIITGGVEIPVVIALGAGVGLAIGWSIQAGLLLGGAFAISSSIVAIKVLMGRGEMGSQHAAIAVGVSVVQDLSLVVMLALVPVLTNEGGNIPVTLATSITVAAVSLALVALVGPRLVRKLLARVAGNSSRDLFLLVVIVIALGTAAAAHEVGLSFALGAFLAGIIVSESEFSEQVAAQINPIRDLFATIFFVAVGMLLEPRVIFDNIGVILVMVAAVVVGKILITGGALLAGGVDHWTTTRAAIVLGQMGEFSFVLAGVGLGKGIIDQQQYGLILSAAIGSIFAMPIMLAASPVLFKIADRLPFVAWRERGWVEPATPDPAAAGHVIICGYGRIGSELASALEAHGVAYAVVDLNPSAVRGLRGSGRWAAWGDAAEIEVLEALGLDTASTIAITIPDDAAARGIAKIARRRHPSIRVIARATTNHLVDAIAEAGADEVVQPEFEAGLEFTRQVLDWHGVAAAPIHDLLARRRGAVYHRSPEPLDEPRAEPALVQRPT